MMNIKQTFFTLLFCTSLSSFAEEADISSTAGYISEDLIVYMHTGAGKNYRIQGSVSSGEKVELTGEVTDGYSEIITDKNRIGWVESKYVSTKPGMRYVIADLNEKLASFQGQSDNSTIQLESSRAQVETLKNERSDLQNAIAALNMELAQTKSQLKNQDTDIKKQWFFNGAIVLGIGLFLGLVLPHIFSKRKNKMENWG